MKNKSITTQFKSLKIPIYIGLIFAVILINACSGDGGAETKKENEQKKIYYVKITKVKTTQFNSSLTVVGIVKPFANAKISSEEGGLIISLNKEKGSYVKKGELIARIKKDVELATLQQNQAQLELARINYEKQKSLYEENATTEIQYLTAKWQYEAALRSTEILKTRLKTGFIRSPINGIVNEKYMNKGEMTAPGTPILSVIDISKVKVSAGIPERYITQIKQGQNVKLTCNILPGVEFEGKISYISPTITTSNRTFEIELIINNNQKLLKPEMSVDVSIIQLSLNDAIVLPQDYITDTAEENFVYILDEGYARKRIITIGGREGNNVLISSGLNAEDKLIYEGFQQLNDGDKVQVIE